MPENRRSPTRRTAIGTLSVLGVSALAIAGAPAEAQTGKPAMTQEQKVVDHRHDWDWLVGRWNVRHHRLKARLAGSTEWEDFNGTSVL